MDLILNELSFYPCFSSIQIAESKFSTFMNTFKEANKIYGIKRVLFPKNISNQQVTCDLNFIQSLEKLENKDLKRSLFTFIKPPYLDDLNDAELQSFLISDYTLIGENIPTEIEPVGLPVSHIKATPSISLDSHVFWRNRKIAIRKSNENTEENIDIIAYNICLENDITSQEMKEWADILMPILIETEDILTKYLGFTKYKSVFTANFIDQFFSWKTEDFKTFKYLLLLMKDVQIHPFTGGMGQTENLIGRGKEASKRITNSYPDGDRLSYTVENNIVTFLACKGHYAFH
jgi:Txe/YoeB family toxin of Txe-Axe toxin-antitoxin module